MSQTQIQVEKPHVPILPPPPMIEETIDKYKVILKAERWIIAGSYPKVYLVMNARVEKDDMELFKTVLTHNINFDETTVNIDELAKAIVEAESKMYEKATTYLSKVKELLNFAIANSLDITIDP